MTVFFYKAISQLTGMINNGLIAGHRALNHVGKNIHHRAIKDKLRYLAEGF